MVRQCYNARFEDEAQFDPFPMGLDTKDELSKKNGEPLDDLLEIPLSRENPSWMAQINSDLDKVTKERLTTFFI